MRRAALLAGTVALVAAGCGSGETVTVRETVTVEAPAATIPPVVPEAVEATRADLLAAAATGNIASLRPYVTEDLSYSFGGPVEGGAIAHWGQLEEAEGVRPIAILEDLLKLPPTYYGGNWVWPFAFPLTTDTLTPMDRELLRDVGGQDLSDDFLPDGGYLGWRVGIEPDGDWIFFIAGD